MLTFMKLAESLGLIVVVRATSAYVEPTFYLSKSKAHSVGDLKSEGRDMECVFITATNGEDFAAHTVWYDGKLDFAKVGSKRPATFTQITKVTGEMKRCLS